MADPNLDLDRPCLHPDFMATVEVGRILPDGADESDMTIPAIKFVALVRVHCVACDEPFRWIGLEAGDMPNRPMVSVDDLELRAPLRPASSDPDFGLGGIGFSVHYRGPEDDEPPRD
jgi:hypothetical protein